MKSNSPNTYLISVVIPTCHRPDELKLCLQQLAPGKQTLDFSSYEVVVTDDSRDQRTHDLVTQEFPWAKWHQGPRRGPAANRNWGAKQATSSWVAFTDDDCIPSPNWLEAFSNNLDKAMVLEGATHPKGPMTRADDEAPVNISGGLLWSCNFAITKLTFEGIKGFDESFPSAAMEDVEFRVRLKKAGVNTEFIKEAIVIHPWRPMRGIEFLKKVEFSMIHFYSKHPDQYNNSALALLLYNISFLKNRVISPILKCRGKGAIRLIQIQSYTITTNIMHWFTWKHKFSTTKHQK
jgi:GT2 family glycosyltransferase